MQQTVDWLSAQLFQMVHANSLIYNTCWEDPALDRQALELSRQDNIMVITSAGCNVLDYALQAPNRIFAVDMNPKQNSLLELKVAAIRRLNYDSFFDLFGRGWVSDFESLYHAELRDCLSNQAQYYWDRNLHYFSRTRIRPSFYFRGGSGTMARLLNYYLDLKKGREAFEALFQARTLEEQRRIYFTELKELLWNPWIRKAMSLDTSLSLVGVPRPQRIQVEEGYAGGIGKFIEDRIEAVLTRIPFRTNYFWNLYLRGQYSRACCPEYLKEENFKSLQSGLLDSIEIYTGTILDFLRQSPLPVSRYVLLDHMDWLSTYNFSVLEKEWQAIIDRATPEARLLWRSGGMRTDFINRIRIEQQGKGRKLTDLLKFHTGWAAELHALDRVHAYGSFYIADLEKSA